jgi:hypothetical protein
MRVFLAKWSPHQLTEIRENGLMAVLARRSVQDLLDDLRVTPTLLQSLIARLNLPGKASLDAEWKLIVLSALARVGTVEYEPSLGGNANLDVRFTSPAGFQFTGEVTALSDDEAERRNPVNHLIREVSRRFEKRGIRGAITIRIGSQQQRTAATLMLPAPHQFTPQLFNREFSDFLDHITNAPKSPRTFRVHTDTTDVVIGYAPGRWQTTVAHTPFKGPRDIVRNALYNRLKKKVDQIKRSGPRSGSALVGTIVCDADCELLHGNPSVAISFERIARHFLSKSTSLDFIAGLSIKTDYAADGHVKPYTFEVRVVDRQPDREEMVAEVLQEGLQQLPRPIRTATTARYCLECQHQHGLTTLQYYDRVGASMADGRITLSARATVDYITGRIDRQRFEILTDDWMLSILRRALDNGGSMRSISVCHNPEADDDSLQIEWRDRDPATAPFSATPPIAGEASGGNKR